MPVATTEPVRLPPRLPIPKVVQGTGFAIASYRMFGALYRVVRALSRHYGGPFTINLPVFGEIVVVGDHVLVKDVFSSSFDLIERPTKILGQAFGPGSTFSLVGKEHLERRKLVLPSFHGKRVKNYERIVEEEVTREIANWPEGREFETLEPMVRITLGAILRAVFGAERAALDELRSVIPPLITLGSLMQWMPPIARREYGRWSPASRLSEYRGRFDAVVDLLVASARADPALTERSDVLALLLQARYEDGEPISDGHIADELLSLVAAGHETTASQLAWAVERLRRHPQLLSRLADEVDAGGSELRQATIYEVQRTRSTIAISLRTAKDRIRLGEWVLPAGTNVMVAFQLAHESEDNYSDADSFNPDRFVGTTPPAFRWIPYGGGVHRCVGAAFAHMEMDIALRTLLREFRFAPTDAPDEGRNFRGVAIAPARGARAVVYRRTAVASPFLNRRLGLHEDDVVFLNYGYEEDPPMGLPLEESDERNRFSIQLYHQTATQVDLSGKKVLEVSCGHGGGASYLARTLRPASYTGLDFNPDGVAFCQKGHQLPGVDFVHGDVESLPFPDESFDAVVNVEASHAYPRFPRFLAEVARVLRPGGHFLYADLRGYQEFSEWEAALADAPMRLLSERVINPEVLRGLEKNSTRSLELIGHLPALLRPFGRLFAGVPGTLIYRELERGRNSYRMYNFSKD